MKTIEWTITVLVLLFFTTSVWAQHNRVKGQLLVQFTTDENVDVFLEKSACKEEVDLGFMRTISKEHHIYLLEFDETLSSGTKVLEWMRSHEEVAYAQYDRIVDIRSTYPDDPHYGNQWTLDKIAAPEVWDINQGGLTPQGDTIVVAVIDKGFEHMHEDLHSNIWSNHAEIANDAIDNDGNGLVDDYYGWNFRWQTDNHSQQPNGSVGHGTAVAGIIGAEGNNNQGVSGVNWNIKMMLLSVRGSESEILRSYMYALNMRKKYNDTNGKEGAFVVATNISLGISYGVEEDYPLWCAIYDELGAAGIVSVAATDNENYNVDEYGDMPTSCSSPYLISVTNTNYLDIKETNAAWGAKHIDLGAPGTPSFTTQEHDYYSIISGTSAAAPHVTGALALLYAFPCEHFFATVKTAPAQAAILMKSFILDGVDKLASLEDKTVSGGRLNMKKAMEKLRTYCGGSIGSMKIAAHPNPVSKAESIELIYDTPTFEKYTISLYDTSGKLVYEQQITPPQFEVKQHTIPLNTIESGLYIAVIRSVRKTVAYCKVVVE